MRYFERERKKDWIKETDCTWTIEKWDRFFKKIKLRKHSLKTILKYKTVWQKKIGTKETEFKETVKQ